MVPRFWKLLHCRGLDGLELLQGTEYLTHQLRGPDCEALSLAAVNHNLYVTVTALD